MGRGKFYRRSISRFIILGILLIGGFLPRVIAREHTALRSSSDHTQDSNQANPAHQRTYRAGPNMSTIHRMRVRRGQDVCVRIDGDDDSDLDLFVYDPAGREVGRSLTPVVDEEQVCFRARRNGTYTIRITNLGMETQYTLEF
jgi:hypothetical protein